MPIYKTTGTLTDAIPSENVSLAQVYLTEDDMTQYLDDFIAEPIEHVEWKLEGDGYHYSVTAFTKRELNDDELRVLSEWTSGQNSDGLGEGFEQQDFAWVEGDDVDPYDNYDPDGHMCSFDWTSNPSKFERVK